MQSFKFSIMDKLLSVPFLKRQGFVLCHRAIALSSLKPILSAVLCLPNLYIIHCDLSQDGVSLWLS